MILNPAPASSPLPSSVGQAAAALSRVAVHPFSNVMEVFSMVMVTPKPCGDQFRRRRDHGGDLPEGLGVGPLTSSVKVSAEGVGLLRNSLVAVLVIRRFLWASVTSTGFSSGTKNTRCLTLNSASLLDFCNIGIHHYKKKKKKKKAVCGR